MKIHPKKTTDYDSTTETQIKYSKWELEPIGKALGEPATQVGTMVKSEISFK
jgi:hypothetical protein